MHFVLGFIMHRLGLRQMPIKYELITTILCRSIRFTQYYGPLSLSFWPGPLSLSFPSLSNTRIGKRAHENFLTLRILTFIHFFAWPIGPFTHLVTLRFRRRRVRAFVLDFLCCI